MITKQHIRIVGNLVVQIVTTGVSDAINTQCHMISCYAVDSTTTMVGLYNMEDPLHPVLMLTKSMGGGRLTVTDDLVSISLETETCSVVVDCRPGSQLHVDPTYPDSQRWRHADFGGSRMISYYRTIDTLVSRIEINTGLIAEQKKCDPMTAEMEKSIDDTINASIECGKALKTMRNVVRTAERKIYDPRGPQQK